jgi:hypothetical protein
MSVGAAALREALIASAQEMAVGMLREPNEAQVLRDLSPANAQVAAGALSSARSSMSIARMTDLDVAATLAMSGVTRTVASMEQQLPALFADLLKGASSTSVGFAAAQASDLIVCVTFGQLLTTFERAQAKYPQSKNGHTGVLGAVLTYLATVDSTIREAASRGIATTSASGFGFRPVMELPFAIHLPFAFVDARVMPGGDKEAVGWFTDSFSSGVLRRTSGSFSAWMSGMSDGPYATPQAAVAMAGLYLLQRDGKL